MHLTVSVRHTPLILVLGSGVCDARMHVGRPSNSVKLTMHRHLRPTRRNVSVSVNSIAPLGAPCQSLLACTASRLRSISVLKEKSARTALKQRHIVLSCLDRVKRCAHFVHVWSRGNVVTSGVSTGRDVSHSTYIRLLSAAACCSDAGGVKMTVRS